MSHHLKKPHITNRQNWDWSLSNCELARQYGMTSQSVHWTRRKLGLLKFQKFRKPANLGCDRSHVKHPPIPLSRQSFTTESVAAFEALMDQCGPDRCWHWLGGTEKRSGYGKAYMRLIGGYRRQLIAHRVSDAIFNGEVPAGLLVMHSCDNKICVNPRHLSLGTDLANSRDASLKGLMHPGVRTFGAVLNEEIVRQIRRRAEIGERKNDIARSIGHHRRTVADVVNNKSWRHVQ